MTELKHLTACVLAGGFGTRLRSRVSDRPKVLAEVCGRPFLAYLLDLLESSGLRKVVLCTGYMGELLLARFGDSYKSLKLLYSQEPTALGTAGALRCALPLFESQSVLVMNGDSFCQTSLARFWQFHGDRQADASVILNRVQDSGRYGRVRINDDGRIFGFDEKIDTREPGWINAGIYLINHKLLEPIELGREVSLERDIFPNWFHHHFFGFENDGRFLDIGTPESYAEAQDFFSQKLQQRLVGA